ncbi:cytochrome c oxidase subunit II [Vulcanococcus limneticus]|uniref:cytochrome c oxidase subunit II n=1 Tax=Vulcanococcus limneticus TaxID=2170428 RepID=UPI00398BCAF7
MTATPPAKPTNRLAIAAVSLWTGLIVLVSHWMAQQSQRWLPVQASSAAPLVDGLFGFETGLGTFIFLGVLTVLAWSLLFHRARKYDESDAEPIEGNTRLEIIWTVIPLVLVLLIAANAIRVNRVLGVLGPMEHAHGGAAPTGALSPGAEGSGPVTSASATSDAAATELQVEVIARQWSWEFRYPLSDGDVQPHGDHDGMAGASGGTGSGGAATTHGMPATVSSTELHLPINRPVTFRLLSEDVLHGFYVPAFRLKQDVVPGQAISFRLTPTRSGRYRLRDSQFSGTWFAANQADVVVESPAAFAHWLELGVQQPLQPGLSPAADDYARRQQRPSNGWATVVPAPPPLVNVHGSVALPHDA